MMPLLMAYALIGETFHEIAGTIAFILFIIHLIFNRRWYKNLFKGRYNARRIFQTVLDLCLLVIMILQPLSGMAMSQHLYTFLPHFMNTGMARRIHLILAYWGYILMSVHAGTHLLPMINRWKKKSKSAFRVIQVILCAVFVYGCYAFVKRGFPGYMSGRVLFAFFDFKEPRIYFFADYIAIMISGMILGAFITKGLSRRKKAS